MASWGDLIGTTTGVINGARNFPGTGGANLVFGTNTTDFSPGSNHFSFSFWFKLNTTSQGFPVGLMKKYQSSPNRQWMCYYLTDDTKVHLAVANDSLGTSADLAWSGPLSAATWYYVAGGWDGTNIWLSVNAATRQTRAFAGPVGPGNDNFGLGGQSSFLKGQMDEAGFWMGRDLTNAEVSQLYNGGAGLPFSSF